MISRGGVGLVLLWLAQVLLALFFVVAATPKFIGTQQAVEQVAMLGFGDWFRYVIGACELAGAVGLVIRPLSGLAAGGLVIVMALATVADVFVLPNPPALPASLMVACVVIAWARREETRSLYRWLVRRAGPAGDVGGGGPPAGAEPDR